MSGSFYTSGLFLRVLYPPVGLHDNFSRLLELRQDIEVSSFNAFRITIQSTMSLIFVHCLPSHAILAITNRWLCAPIVDFKMIINCF